MQVVNAVLGASLMMLGGALAFRYRFSDRASLACTSSATLLQCTATEPAPMPMLQGHDTAF